jgi:hypothetical protein
LGYPNNPNYTEKKSAKEFYESLAFLIPCAICREHYTEHLAKHPLTPSLDSKKDLLKWTIDVHNAVNKMLGKSEWTELEVVTYYERLGRRDRSPVWTKEDMKEVDYHSFVKGFLTGTVVLSGLGGLIYMVNKFQMSG